MIDSEQWMDIKQLHQQGLSGRQIAHVTGHARNTVAKALAQPVPQVFQKPERASCLDAFKPYLKQRYEAYGLSGVRLREEIADRGEQNAFQPQQPSELSATESLEKRVADLEQHCGRLSLENDLLKSWSRGFGSEATRSYLIICENCRHHFNVFRRLSDQAS